MAANAPKPGKIPKELTLEREQQAWELRTQKFWTQARIAQEIGVSQPAVHKMLSRISLRVRGRLDTDVVSVQLSQVSQLETLVQEMYEAWTESRKPVRTVASSGEDSMSGKGDASLFHKGKHGKQVRTEVKTTAGDVALVRAMLQAMSDIRKIVGADAPIELDIDHKVSGGISIKQEVSVELGIQERLPRLLSILRDIGGFDLDLDRDTDAKDNGVDAENGL